MKYSFLHVLDAGLEFVGASLQAVRAANNLYDVYMRYREGHEIPNSCSGQGVPGFQPGFQPGFPPWFSEYPGQVVPGSLPVPRGYGAPIVFPLEIKKFT